MEISRWPSDWPSYNGDQAPNLSSREKPPHNEQEQTQVLELLNFMLNDTIKEIKRKRQPTNRKALVFINYLTITLICFNPFQPTIAQAQGPYGELNPNATTTLNTDQPQDETLPTEAKEPTFIDPTPSPTSTPYPTSTSTPSPTSTPYPTSTSTPSPTSTSTSTPNIPTHHIELFPDPSTITNNFTVLKRLQTTYEEIRQYLQLWAKQESYLQTMLRASTTTPPPPYESSPPQESPDPLPIETPPPQESNPLPINQNELPIPNQTEAEQPPNPQNLPTINFNSINLDHIPRETLQFLLENPCYLTPIVLSILMAIISSSSNNPRKTRRKTRRRQNDTITTIEIDDLEQWLISLLFEKTPGVQISQTKSPLLKKTFEQGETEPPSNPPTGFTQVISRLLQAHERMTEIKNETNKQTQNPYQDNRGQFLSDLKIVQKISPILRRLTSTDGYYSDLQNNLNQLMEPLNAHNPEKWQEMTPQQQQTLIQTILIAERTIHLIQEQLPRTIKEHNTGYLRQHDTLLTNPQLSSALGSELSQLQNNLQVTLEPELRALQLLQNVAKELSQMLDTKRKKLVISPNQKEQMLIIFNKLEERANKMNLSNHPNLASHLINIKERLNTVTVSSTNSSTLSRKHLGTLASRATRWVYTNKEMEYTLDTDPPRALPYIASLLHYIQRNTKLLKEIPQDKENNNNMAKQIERIDKQQQNAIDTLQWALSKLADSLHAQDIPHYYIPILKVAYDYSTTLELLNDNQKKLLKQTTNTVLKKLPTAKYSLDDLSATPGPYLTTIPHLSQQITTIQEFIGKIGKERLNKHARKHPETFSFRILNPLQKMAETILRKESNN